MNCGQQFGQQMAFCNRLLLQVNYGQQDFLNRFITSHLEETNKNIRRKIFRFYDGYGADGGSRTHATVSCPKAFRVNLRKGVIAAIGVSAGWFVR